MNFGWTPRETLQDIKKISFMKRGSCESKTFAVRKLPKQIRGYIYISMWGYLQICALVNLSYKILLVLNI